MAGAVQQAALLLPCQEKEIKKMVLCSQNQDRRGNTPCFLAKHLFVCCSSSHIDDIEEKVKIDYRVIISYALSRWFGGLMMKSCLVIIIIMASLGMAKQ